MENGFFFYSMECFYFSITYLNYLCNWYNMVYDTKHILNRLLLLRRFLNQEIWKSFMPLNNDYVETKKLNYFKLTFDRKFKFDFNRARLGFSVFIILKSEDDFEFILIFRTNSINPKRRLLFRSSLLK